MQVKLCTLQLDQNTFVIFATKLLHQAVCAFSKIRCRYDFYDELLADISQDERCHWLADEEKALSYPHYIFTDIITRISQYLT